MVMGVRCNIVRTCDICGNEVVESQPPPVSPVDGSFAIEPLVIDLQNHAGVKKVAFDGYCCDLCGLGLVRVIQDYVAVGKLAGPKKREKTAK